MIKGISVKWFYLIALAFVWGSTFILMKKALIGLGPFQLGSVRIVLTIIFLLGFAYEQRGTLRKSNGNGY